MFFEISFLKKPLIALYLLTIVHLFLSIAEAAPQRLEHPRRLHRRFMIMTPPTTTSQPAIPKTSLNIDLKLYKNATIKITNRLRNTYKFFMEGLKEINESTDMIDDMAAWLPKMDFGYIELKSEELKSHRHRLILIFPKLYQHLMEYHVILEILHTEVICRDEMNDVTKRRKDFLSSMINKLDAFITDVTDVMDTLKIQMPKFEDNKMNLTTLKKNTDGTQCFIQYNIAYRGYENLLKNWYLAFQCSNKITGKTLEYLCKNYLDKVKNEVNE